MNDIVQIFKALGDETRLKILLMLSKRRICAKGIAKHLEISEAAVSQHVKVLKEAGIIVGEKIGYFIHYDIQKPMLLELIRFIEQINSNTESHQTLDLNIPKGCRISCNTSKNLCCQRNKK